MILRIAEKKLMRYKKIMSKALVEDSNNCTMNTKSLIKKKKRVFCEKWKKTRMI